MIESGNLLERIASNGLCETYEVVHPGFYEKFHNMEAHQQVVVRNVRAPTRPPIKKQEEVPAGGFHSWRATKNWWRGRWIDSTLESLFPDYAEATSPDRHYERPWLAKGWIALADYWKNHWKFTITILVTIAGIVVGAYVTINYGK